MTKPISFRAAVETDIVFLKQCAHLAYAQYIEAMGCKPAPMVADFHQHLQKHCITVAERDGSAEGFAVWWFEETLLFLENIAVLPAQQGQGVSRILFEHLESEARHQGKAAIELYTNEKMTANLALYPYLGFIETKRVTEKGFNRVYFRKTL